jgi:tetratricopeptide (TPR) repeat protein
MTLKNKISALVVALVVVCCASVADAQNVGRLKFVVVDSDDKPVAGAVVKVTTQESAALKGTKKTNKRGTCTITMTDVLHVFQVEVSAPGYQTATGDMQGAVDETTVKRIILAPEGQVAASEAVMTAEEREKYVLASRKVRLYNEGVELKDAGDLDAAMEKFQQSIEADDEFAPAYTGMAMAAVEAGKYADAAAAADRAVALDPENYQALLVRYDAYRLVGDTKKAEAAADDLKKAGDPSEAANRIFHEGVNAFNSGDPEGAKARFQQALALDPEIVQAYANLAQLFLREGNAKQAAANADEVLARTPGDATALRVRYDASLRMGDQDGAQKALAGLVEADPQWAAANLLDHAAELFNEGHTEQAAVVLEELLEIAPDEPMAHYMLGLCLNSTGDMASAKPHLERFLELAPDHEQAASAREILRYMQ